MRYRPPEWFIRLHTVRDPALATYANTGNAGLLEKESKTAYTAPSPGGWKDRFLNLDRSSRYGRGFIPE